MINEVLNVMRDLVKEGMTMGVVTHEMGFAREGANRVVFMNEGRSIEIAAPTDVNANSQSPRSRAFLSKILTH
jgi:ABC-type polar amino acid transport system ATPase subunit